MRTSLVLLTVLALSTPGLGQNLLTNPSFDDPPVVPPDPPDATVNFMGTIADADTIEIDTTGVNRVYEFDTGDGIRPGSDVAVDVSGGLDATNARDQFVAAVNGDPQAPCTAEDAGGAGAWRFATLIWIGTGGVGATNTNNHDTNDKIWIGNFEGVNPCGKRDTQDVTAWIEDYWENDPHPLNARNVEIYIPHSCDENGHASIDRWFNFNQEVVYQNVSGLDPAKTYTFSGEWTVGQEQGVTLVGAELHNGHVIVPLNPDPTRFAQVSSTKDKNGQVDWLPFAVSGSPSGSDVTVLIRMHRLTVGSGHIALHVDNVVLEETPCPPAKIDSITPNEAFAGASLNDVAIAGSGFVAGVTVKLRGDFPLADIIATDVQVIDSNNLTCDLDLTAVDSSQWRAVIVESPGCGGNSLVDEFNIIKAGPFENGGFELDDPGNAGCSDSIENDAPSRWQGLQQAGFGAGSLYRDEIDFHPPTCPPQEGDHYASSTSDAAGGAQEENRVFQTIDATPGTTYTFSGFLAGGGNNNVFLELLDGDANAALIPGASLQVYASSGFYDWTFATVSGAPTGTLMTVQYRIRLTGEGPHAVHADEMTVEECLNPITVDSIAPATGVNNGIQEITNLAGTGFNIASTPKVLFSKAGGGATVNAVQGSVNVVSDTQITCQVDLTGLTSGYYDVIVVQDGCAGRLSEADPPTPLFLVVSDGLMNGEFEDPPAEVECDPEELTGPATGWNFNDDRWRDHFMSRPTCPRDVPGPGTHGHYGSLTTGAERGYRDQKAWQTLSAQPQQVYKLSGWFAGGGTNVVNIRMREGDIDGPIRDTTEVYACSTGCGDYDWGPASAGAMALTDVMTVEWELTGATGESATHADGFTFEPVCHDPYADVDGDGDVDQTDFGILQVCVPGGPGDLPPDPIDPYYCLCFDRDGDGAITQADVGLFEDCASGPGITADVTCDD